MRFSRAASKASSAAKRRRISSVTSGTVTWTCSPSGSVTVSSGRNTPFSYTASIVLLIRLLLVRTYNDSRERKYNKQEFVKEHRRAKAETQHIAIAPHQYESVRERSGERRPVTADVTGPRALLDTVQSNSRKGMLKGNVWKRDNEV